MNICLDDGMGFGIGSAEYLKGRGGSWLRAAICTGGKEPGGLEDSWEGIPVNAQKIREQKTNMRHSEMIIPNIWSNCL